MMNWLDFPEGPAQQWAAFIVLISGGLLCGALFFEFVLDMPPCPLCMMQRIWFVVCAILAYASLMHAPRMGIYPLLTILAALTGGYFAGRHIWIQNLPADQVPACAPDLDYMIEVLPLGDILTAMTSGSGDCAELSWSFIGITLPGWALVGFVAIVICAAMQLKSSIR